MDSDSSRSMDVGMEQTTNVEPTEEELVPKRGNRNSVVWVWFGYKKTDTDQKKVICKICHREVATTDSSTTNLFYHLKTRHAEQYNDSLKMQQSTKANVKAVEKKSTQASIKESMFKGTPYDKDSRRHIEITDAITAYMSTWSQYTVLKRRASEHWSKPLTRDTKYQTENTSAMSSCPANMKNVVRR